MTRVRAAIVQAFGIASATVATVVNAVELIQDCGRGEAQLVVFSEAFVGGYPKGASPA